MIQVFKPSITEAEIQAVTETLKSGWLGSGPKTKEFEDAFAQYVGTKHAIAVNSCTAALHLALASLNIGEGDEVIVPTLSFISTAHCVEMVGAKVIFADVDPKTLCIDPKDIVDKMSAKTKAIICVHFAGYPCNIGDVANISRELGLYVIEDCAHAVGAVRNLEHVGTFGDIGCFSFHAVKNLAVGDGGMLVTSSTELVEKIKRLRWCGISKDTWNRMGLRTDPHINDTFAKYGWYYEVHDLGWKYQMNDISASIGLVQLSRIEELNARRKQIAKQYTAGLYRHVDTPPDHEGHAWHIYQIRTYYRDALLDYLGTKGIATGVHYMPIHLQPYYRKCGIRLPVAERLWPKLLSLPMYYDLTDKNVEYIIKHIKEGLKYVA